MTLTQLPHPRFVLFLAVFALASFVALLWMPFEMAMIFGFDLSTIGFIVSFIPLWQDDRPESARKRAARDDGNRTLLVLTAVLVITAILTALGWMIESRQGLKSSDFAVVAGTLVLAWLFSNLVFSLHYAHLYYDQGKNGDVGGILFPADDPPVFADFVYFAFTIGMTCQTADLDISARGIRRVVTMHALFAFFFNLGVLALTINVLSGVL